MQAFSDPAFSSNKSAPLHRWVPWIAGFSAEFVAGALERHLPEGGSVLDPFCGVGTTLVEVMLSGRPSLGFEINPWAALASRVKTRAAHVQPDGLAREMERLREFLGARVAGDDEPRSRPPAGFRSRGPFYSPRVLRQVLFFQDHLVGVADESVRDLFRVAFASTMVGYSNYSYEPSLGRRASAGRADVDDFPVSEAILRKLEEMRADVAWLRERLAAGAPLGEARVLLDSFFHAPHHLAPASVDLVVTSPPYLNNYHYGRNTRPQLYWLGFASRPADLRPLEEANFGKFWQTVRERAHLELDFALPGSELPKQLAELRALRPLRGVYGGNGWANYAAAYFNDCHRFARELARVLRPGATALVVIGNSILQGLAIPTDRYLGEIAVAAGLELAGHHVPRAERVGSSIIRSPVRVARAAAGRRLYEAVLELRRPARRDA